MHIGRFYFQREFDKRKSYEPARRMSTLDLTFSAGEVRKH